jgi:uncharacterized protein YyaL (SSP411 family)
MKYRILLAAALYGAIPAWAGNAPAEGIAWRDWSDDAFSQAQREHKLVLLDLGAAWCHWCHVMDDTTYSDGEVRALLAKDYVTVRVDQDARPDLSRRYEQYGWPATIIFAADGTEIVKRRGYVEPATMKKVLQESFDDPEPNPHQTVNYPASSERGLSQAQRDRILATLVYGYDQQHGGWGDGQKFLDASTMEFALTRANEENWVFSLVSKETLQASFNLVDPVWGGVYQYSDQPDWKSPHFEKIVSLQSAYLFSYAYGYQVFKDEKYRGAAHNVLRYLDAFLIDAGGAFYISQDADVSSQLTGHAFYAMDDGERRKVPQPGIDKNIYANENGTLISALLAAYAMAGDEASLSRAEHAMDWIRANRALGETGGFMHGAHDRGGPFLSDTLAMSRAMLDMYAVTGRREWLSRAKEGAYFIEGHFSDHNDGGFFTADPRHGGVLKPYKEIDENLAAVRFFNLLSYYAHDTKLAGTAAATFQSVSSPEQLKRNSFAPGLLLADAEIKAPPLHLTIVGAKSDPQAQALFTAAIATAPTYKQTEWYDSAEGKLPGSDISFPKLPQAAAFLCTGNFCSAPVFDAKALTVMLDEM